MCATLPFSLNKKKKQNNHPKNMLVIACFIRTFKITKYTVKKTHHNNYSEYAKNISFILFSI